MADETTQAEEVTSWWAFDAFADSELPSTSFDEPLEWPEALDWGDTGDPGAGPWFPETYDPRAGELSGPIFPPALDAEWQPATAGDPPAPAAGGDGEATVTHATPLAALGGAPMPAVHDQLPDSIWSATVPAAGAGAAHTVTADLDRDRPGGWRRFDLRHGNAAMIALISFASLVLLGMFMSVRARNDVPTETSRTPTTSDQIAVQGTLNTVPLTIPSSTSPPATINIADLVPAAEAAGAASDAAGSGGAGAATATTAPRATATTAPAPPTNTTTAPATTQAPVPTTDAPPPPPPPNDTTVTTRRTTTTSFPFPAFPTPTGGGTSPTSFPFPLPPGFGFG